MESAEPHIALSFWGHRVAVKMKADWSNWLRHMSTVLARSPVQRAIQHRLT
ncbi:hypothetical protein NSU_4663 [Novosphingobium pentaromativorans US6-1]|uniref:Uncharacterized protein n=1 Tax=Novosphingobium pentaromativorans US6-1 TaxID=1088721 RepID=G6EJZ2_9SPHN|nr:hypothetical protein NSU_4663 [Novosphingobium pentaromativorans US6-1]